MKNISKYYKKLTIIGIRTSFVAIIASIFLLPGFMKIERTGDNMFTVYLNEKKIGISGNTDVLDECMRIARLNVAKDNESMLLIDTDIRVAGEERFFGKVDSPSSITENMEIVLRDSVRKTLSRSYTVKLNDYIVNLKSGEEVLALLESSIDKYDERDQYKIELKLNPNRELNVLTASVKPIEEEEKPLVSTVGVETALADMLKDVEPAREKEFSEFELGLKELYYENSVEVVEAYLLEEELTSVEIAKEEVNKEQEKEEIYEVTAGDTLSGISLKTNLPVEKIIEMNNTLENEFSTLQIGQELVVTVPEPELTVMRVEENYYEENYDAEIIYVPNDDWYTTDKVTRQEPSAGHRKVVAKTTYRNEKEVNREVVKEEVVMQAVPKIVEKGTKIPPTYVKPLSGGRLSSQFGRRNAPTRGASTFHKGMDWATPRGTTVVASSSGTIIKAGWGSGYGYVVYIDHGDGRQTRYAHLSKTLVKAGQYVEQGQRIALSGNTGISSGPHVHFEILINGAHVNPAKYLN